MRMSVNDEVFVAGLAEQAALLASGRVSAVELVSATLDRIEGSQDSINAFAFITRDAAMAEAAAADERLAAGERLPLLGVPMAVKDEIDVAGLPTTIGCPGEFPVATADSETVRRLRAAGAVIVGKTTLPELGQWTFTESTTFGITRNPWNLDHTPGGSSGGTAAAVAAGLLPAAVGTDGGGSNRIPAGWTGLVGIKPQLGRVPDDGLEVFNGTAILGPLARTVGDAALLLDVMAGTVTGAGRFAAAAEADVRPLRIGVTFASARALGDATPLDPEIRSAVDDVANALRALGHEVVERDLSFGPMIAAFVMLGASGLTKQAELADHAALDPRTRENIRTGRLAGPLLPAGKLLRRILSERLARVFAEVDLILTPTNAVTAPRIGASADLSGLDLTKWVLGNSPYCWPWNVTGWPGIGFPAGLSSAGLPIGAQLLGPADSEALLISVTAQLERRLRWQDRRAPHWR